MRQDFTVRRGIRLAVQRPGEGAVLLAKTLSDVMSGQDWIDDSDKMKFCIMFVSNLIDRSIEKEIDEEFKAVKERVKRVPFTHGIKLLKKRPGIGLKILISIVMEEIRDRQKLSEGEQFEFYDQLASHFFPNIRLSDFRQSTH